jgi:hypothetical protein
LLLGIDALLAGCVGDELRIPASGDGGDAGTRDATSAIDDAAADSNAGPEEAGMEPDSSLDAGSDAPGAADDGSAFDGAAPDAGGTTAADPCTTGSSHTLCDDFDRPTLATWWSLPGPCRPPTLDAKAFLSPPQSLLSQVDGNMPNCAAVAATLPVFPHVRCAFDLRVDQQPQNYTDVFVLYANAPGIDWWEVSLALDPLHVVLTETRFETDGGFPFQRTVVPPPATPLTQWNHLVLDVDWNAGRASANAAAGDAIITLQYAPTETLVTGLGIHVGIPYSGAPYIATLRHDNLVCDAAR